MRLPQLRICWLRPSCSLRVLLFVSALLAADHASGKKTAGQLQGAFIGNLYGSTGEDLRVLLSVAVLWLPRRGCSTGSVGMARVGISRTDNLVDQFEVMCREYARGGARNTRVLLARISQSRNFMCSTNQLARSQHGHHAYAHAKLTRCRSRQPSRFLCGLR